MTGSADLVERLRGLVAGRDDVREVSMFRGRAFMVADQMAVSARPEGSLLVRVDPSDYDRHLASGAVPAMMGEHRAMGRGWLVVPHTLIGTDSELGRWLDIGIASRDARRQSE